MKKICVISDSHGYLPTTLMPYIRESDEVWHAGDIGDIATLQTLAEKSRRLRVVWGNADGYEIKQYIKKTREEVREDLPSECLFFSVEGVKILMIHIGGHPGHYATKIPQLLRLTKPQIFVAGHSHILRVMYDNKYDCLHINPGACGKFGAQTVPTAISFVIDNGDIRDLEVIELGKRRIDF